MRNIGIDNSRPSSIANHRSREYELRRRWQVAAVAVEARIEEEPEEKGPTSEEVGFEAEAAEASSSRVVAGVVGIVVGVVVGG